MTNKQTAVLCFLLGVGIGVGIATGLEGFRWIQRKTFGMVPLGPRGVANP